MHTAQHSADGKPPGARLPRANPIGAAAARLAGDDAKTWSRPLLDAKEGESGMQVMYWLCKTMPVLFNAGHSVPRLQWIAV